MKEKMSQIDKVANDLETARALLIFKDQLSVEQLKNLNENIKKLENELNSLFKKPSYNN